LVTFEMTDNCRISGISMAAGESMLTAWKQPAAGGKTLTIASGIGIRAASSSLAISTAPNSVSFVRFVFTNDYYAYVESTGLILI